MQLTFNELIMHHREIKWILIRVLQVFVWIGNEAHDEEKTEAMTSGKTP